MRTVTDYNDQSAIIQWERIPIDDVGYINSNEILAMDDDAFESMAYNFERTRYNGWRNIHNLWRDTLGLDITEGKTILDYGCGFGMESLQFAKKGNIVIASDISDANLSVARRLMNLHGYSSTVMFMKVSVAYPYIIQPLPPIDVFYANGVLHHTPHATDILKEIKRFLSHDGEVRLMLYSDIGFKWATGELPTDPKQDITEHPKFKQFVARFDGTGSYADWYNLEKINVRFGEDYTIDKFNYIAEVNNTFGIFCTVTLIPK